VVTTVLVSVDGEVTVAIALASVELPPTATTE